MSAGLQEALLHFCPLSLVSEFPLHEILSEYPVLPYYVRLVIFSIIILLIRTLADQIGILLLYIYQGLLHTVMKWIIWFSITTRDAPATSNINHKHHSSLLNVGLFNPGCLILSILIYYR